MNLPKITLNFLAVLLLAATIATPLYFAKNFASVAGVKSQSLYLIVSQIEKFPNLTLSQNGDNYTIAYQKFGQSQAFLDVLILNNPTNQTQTYTLETISGGAQVFFGNDLDDQRTGIKIPSGASISISLMSASLDNNQSAEFKISAR